MSHLPVNRYFALLGATALIAALPAPSAGAIAPAETHPLSGSESAAGHTAAWSITGAYPVPTNRPDLLAYPYDGVIYQGSTVGLSGSTTFTLGAGLASNLDMTASLGFMMDAKQTQTLRKSISAGTFTMPFSLKIPVPRTRRAAFPLAPAAPLNTVQALVSSRNCNDDGVCDGLDVVMYLALLPGKAPKADAPPTVKAKPHEGTIRKGRSIPARFTVYDTEGPVQVTADLYDGGTLVASKTTSGWIPSGHSATLMFDSVSGGKGPFFYCAHGVDKAGNASPGGNKSSCAWLSVEVPIGNVSNGCGTPAFGAGLELLQNTLGDTRSYGGKVIEVKRACNLHDAAYIGATVYDEFANKAIDFRTMSRKQADHKFLEDIRTLCRQQLKKRALKDCLNGVEMPGLQALITSGAITVTGATVIGALSYWDAVRKHGGVGYDWDGTTPDTQHSMPATTNPKGGGRNGA